MQLVGGCSKSSAKSPRPEATVATRAAPENGVFNAAYFLNRRALEPKHTKEAEIWKEHFHPRTFLDAGCGVGQRVFSMQEIGVESEGFDISVDAITTSPFKERLGNKLFVGDITKKMTSKQYDLVLVYDVFEHLSYDQLDVAMKQIFNYVAPGKNAVFSIPFRGDPNLERDPTHIIKEMKDWWINHVEKTGFKLLETPRNFPFRGQMLVVERPA